MNPQETAPKYLETVDLEMARYIYSTTVKDKDTFKNMLYDEDEKTEEGGKYPFTTYYKNVMNYLEKVINNKGKIFVTYKKASGTDEGRDYAVGFGIQSLQYKLRGALCRNLYKDYDMVNCHPVILLHLVKENKELKPYEYSQLEAYVNNRHEILKSENLTKMTILVNINTDKHVKTKNEWLKSFNNQLCNIKEKLLLDKDIPTDNVKNPISSRINKLLCSYENNIITDVIEHHKLDTCVKMFDGVMTDKELDITALNMRTAGYGITWAIKEHDKSIMVGEYTNIETPFKMRSICNLKYKEMKVEFEKNNRMITFPLTYLSFVGEEWRHYCKKLIKEKYAPLKVEGVNAKGEPTMIPFIDKWTEDADRLEFSSMDFYPYNKDPSKCPENVHNTFTGFERATATTFDDEKMTLFVDEYLRPLLMGLTSNFIEAVEHLIKLIAWKIQYPDRLNGIVIVLKGYEGGGKDTLLKILSKLLGARFVFGTDKCKTAVGDFNGAIENKLIIQFNEQKNKDGNEFTDNIKFLATAETIPIQRKGKEIYDVRNCAMLVVFSNNNNPVVVGDTNRRFFVNNSNDANIGAVRKVEFFEPLYENLKDEKMLNSLFKWFTEMDLTGFNASKFPISKVQEAMRQNSIHPLKKYFYKTLTNNFTHCNDYKRIGDDKKHVYIKTCDLLNDVREYVDKLGLEKSWINDKNLRLQLSEMEGIVVGVRKVVDGDRTRYNMIDTNILLEHLKKMYFKDDDEDDEDIANETVKCANDLF